MSWSEPRAVSTPSASPVTSLAAGAILVVLALVFTSCAPAAPAASGASAGAPASPSAPTLDASAAVIAVDAGLLDVLPTSVAGAALTDTPGAAAGMLSDQGLRAAASGIAVASVIAPGDSSGDDLAVATVIRLRPGIYSDGFYQRWRADYDAAACEPAGGVSSHLQQRIGLHVVEVTVCAQGARTYQAHLPGDLVIAVTSVGARQFGELIMAGLRQ